MFKVYIILLSFYGTICYGNRVTLKQGIVEGTHKKSYDGRIFTAFEGIPYAQPPVGDLRFKEPLAASSWDDILTANKSYLCPQILDGTQIIAGTEDCLYMYVYVPKENVDKNDNFDVVVHIHGGFLKFGSPFEMVQPEYIMDKDIIMVSFNYRLGALGFLSTGDCLVYGNNGFKDQVVALKWIKNNIKNFGGNPDSITITGFSAGGSSVQFHYLSPLSKGLFNRGWSSSFTVLVSSSLTLIPLEKTKKLAENLQCPNGNKKTMIDCLRKKPFENLVQNFVWFKPVVENGNPNAFIPDIPYKMLKEKKVQDLPWINSNVLDESMFFLDSVYKNRSEIYGICNNFTEWGKEQLDLKEYVDEKKIEETLDKIKKIYLNDCKLTEKNGLEKLNRMLTDRQFHVPAELGVRLQAAATNSPVYYYLFKFIPEDQLQLAGPHVASHTVDIKLVFKFRTNPEKLQPKGEKMMRLLKEFLANFAKTGIPKLGNCTWTPIDPRKNTFNILEIKSPENIKMKEIGELAPTSFWESLLIKENKNLL